MLNGIVERRQSQGEEAVMRIGNLRGGWAEGGVGRGHLKKPKRKAQPSEDHPVLLTTSTNTVCASFLSV